MPALILFRRRWKLSSDDLTIPAVILAALHFLWTGILIYLLILLSISGPSRWFTILKQFIIGLVVIFSACSVLEMIIAGTSLRGSPLKVNARSSVPLLIYARLGILAVEVFWEILGIVWIVFNSDDSTWFAMACTIGFLVFNWLVTFVMIGRFEKAPPLRDNLKCSGQSNFIPLSSIHPSTIEEVISENMHDMVNKNELQGNDTEIYNSIHESINKHVAPNDTKFYGSHNTCCFPDPSKRNSYSQLERVLSFTLSDLDLVPSDVVAGLVLLKKTQRSMQDMTIAEPSNEVYQFLSGTPITSTTRFLGFKSQGSIEFYSRVVRFMKYPLAAHKLVKSKVFRQHQSRRWKEDDKRYLCHRSSRIKQSRNSSTRLQNLQSEPVERELANLIGQTQFELLHCSLLSMDLDGMSFFVGLDHQFKSVVICIWNALCLKDVMVKMCRSKASSHCILVRPDWSVSEYFAVLAEKIYVKLKDESLLLKALSHDQSSGTECYELIITGQSMAGGVACVLSILLKQFYHNLHCFAYAPPNSIFGAACLRETRSFITTVVIGKDIVPRLSCNQLEAFRQSLVSNLKSCNSPKLKVLCTQRPSACCPSYKLLLTNQHAEYLGREGELSNKSAGLYLPGKVIHIVRSHPKTSCSNRMSQCKRHSVFQAVWARNEDFKDILVSRKMISDHSPFLIMDALEKVLTHISPAKPVRKGVTGRHHKGHNRPIISVNSSHNETTMTSQNTVSDFSTSEQLIESTYAPATLSMALPDPPSLSVQGFFNHNSVIPGKFSDGQFEIGASYIREGNQTFPKVKLRSSRPCEFSNRAIKIAPQQLMSGEVMSDQVTEGLYNTINFNNQYENHFLPGLNSTKTHIDKIDLGNEPNNKRQPIIIDNWTGAFAPLASPEALSESSSLASCGESSSGGPVGFIAGFSGHHGDSIKRLSSGAAYQRLVARIDPIRQSPLGPVHPFSGSDGGSGAGMDIGSQKDLPERIKSSQKSSIASKSTTGSYWSNVAGQEQSQVVEGAAVDLATFLGRDPDGKESYYAEIGELTDRRSSREVRGGVQNHAPSDWAPSNASETLRQMPKLPAISKKSDSLYDLLLDTSPNEHPNCTLFSNFPQERRHGDVAINSDNLMMFSPPSFSSDRPKTRPEINVAALSDVALHHSPVVFQQQQQQRLARRFEGIASSLPSFEPIYSRVIPKPERKAGSVETGSSGTSLTLAIPMGEADAFNDDDKSDDVSSKYDYSGGERCNDNDCDESQGQVLYDLVVGHYSSAGRGYPHGFIESYSGTSLDRTMPYSVAEELTDLQPDVF